MCGLVGLSGVASHPAIDISVATTLLQHRGPDAMGQWSSGNHGILLGHTRLKILDLHDRANQPIRDESANLTLVFNGEIYNWQELRQELESKGYHFKTDSDSEVLLALYKEYARGMLRKLRGMYVFALWDGQTETLFCARDPLGKKPFVYAELTEGFFFASEQAALLSILPREPEVNQRGFANLLLHNLRHIPDPETAWKGVFSLRPGHALCVQRGRITKEWRHWHPQRLLEVSPESIKSSIEQAVRKRMIADVPVGVLLSGGIDSSAIASIMKKHTNERLKSYVLGRNAADEDVRRAKIVARQLGLEHRELYFDEAELWERQQALIEAFASPVALLPLVYTHQLCEKMKADGVSVALSGHGADELFNGYTGQWKRALLSRTLHVAPFVASALACFNPGFTALSAEKGKRRAALYRQSATSMWTNLFRDDLDVDSDCYVAAELEELGAVGYSEFYCDESNFAALLLENQHSLALAADFPAMQTGVEIRCPFMDVDLLEQVFSLALHKRVPLWPCQEKVFLKRMLREWVPAEVFNLPKRGFGFGIQEANLFRNEWKGRCEEIFLQESLPIFNAKTVRTRWKEFLAGDDSRAAFLARILSVLLWYRSYGA